MRFAHAALTAVAHGGDPQDRAASLATTGRQSLQRGEPPRTPRCLGNPGNAVAPRIIGGLY